MKYLKKIIIFSLISLFLLNACTYKKINSQNQKKFNIQEINVNGDGRTAFLIKKKVNRYSNSESNNNIIITIELSKSSDIEEVYIESDGTNNFELEEESQASIVHERSDVKPLLPPPRPSPRSN